MTTTISLDLFDLQGIEDCLQTLIFHTLSRASILLFSSTCQRARAGVSSFIRRQWDKAIALAKQRHILAATQSLALAMPKKRRPRTMMGNLGDRYLEAVQRNLVESLPLPPLIMCCFGDDLCESSMLSIHPRFTYSLGRELTPGLLAYFPPLTMAMCINVEHDFMAGLRDQLAGTGDSCLMLKQAICEFPNICFPLAVPARQYAWPMYETNTPGELALALDAIMGRTAGFSNETLYVDDSPDKRQLLTVLATASGSVEALVGIAGCLGTSTAYQSWSSDILVEALLASDEMAAFVARKATWSPDVIQQVLHDPRPHVWNRMLRLLPVAQSQWHTLVLPVFWDVFGVVEGVANKELLSWLWKDAQLLTASTADAILRPLLEHDIGHGHPRRVCNCPAHMLWRELATEPYSMQLAPLAPHTPEMTRRYEQLKRHAGYPTRGVYSRTIPLARYREPHYPACAIEELEEYAEELQRDDNE
jgi:hypothetical protein